MSKKQDQVSLVIPKDYCIMGIKVIEGDIKAIGVNKIKNNCPMINYYVNIENSIEGIDDIISRVLDIIGTNTIYYANEETEIELLKNKCESMQRPITNELLNVEELLKDLGITTEEIIQIDDNAKETELKEIYNYNEILKNMRIEQKYFIAAFLDLRV